MAQLNIKDEETHGLVSELALRRGISKSAAVKAAVIDALAQTPALLPPAPSDAEVARKVEEITAWLAGSAARWGDKRTSKELMDDMYDEDGLPI